MNTTVRQLIHRKGNAVWAVQLDSTVFDALTFMAELCPQSDPERQIVPRDNCR